MLKSLISFRKPKVSVVIVNYNTRDLTLACLKSLAGTKVAQTIVIDNASTDDSVGAIRKLFLKTRVVQNSFNVGFAKAANRGLRLATGAYILFLNSDTRVLPHSVEVMARYLDKHPETGIVGSQLLNTDGSVQPSCFHPQGLLTTFKAYWLGQRSLAEKYAPKSDDPTSVWALVGAALMVRRSLAKKLGGFDEKFFFYFEDLDLCRRANALGFTIVYLPSARMIHFHGASGKTSAKFAYLTESFLYPLKKILGQWRGDSSQAAIVESSIKYHGWFKHVLISLLIKFSPQT